MCQLVLYSRQGTWTWVPCLKRIANTPCALVMALKQEEFCMEAQLHRYLMQPLVNNWQVVNCLPHSSFSATSSTSCLSRLSFPWYPTFPLQEDAVLPLNHLNLQQPVRDSKKADACLYFDQCV